MFSGAHLNVNGWESRVKLKSIFSISPFSTSQRRTAAVLGIRIGSALRIHFCTIFLVWSILLAFVSAPSEKQCILEQNWYFATFEFHFGLLGPFPGCCGRKAPHCTSGAPTTHLLSLGLSVLPRDFSVVSFYSIVANWTNCFEPYFLWSAPVFCSTVAAFWNCPGIACGSRFQRPKVQPEKTPSFYARL